MVHHDAAGTDPHLPGEAGDPGDQDLRRRPGEADRMVMLRQPVAMIAEPVAGLRQLEGLCDGLRRRAALGNRRLVENTGFHVTRLAIASASRAA